MESARYSLKIKVSKRERDELGKRAELGRFRSVAAYIRYAALYGEHHAIIRELQNLAVEVRLRGAAHDEVVALAIRALKLLEQ